MEPNPATGHRPTRRRLLWAALGAVAVGGWLGRAEAAYVVRHWPADKATPRLELVDLDGKTWDLAALKGRPVLLNFWASWCEPCRTEMPSLEVLATQHRREGLMLLTINYQEAPAAIRRFLDVAPFSYPILLDRNGAVTEAWTSQVFPTTVLIDRNGTARQQVLGALDWKGPVAAELLRPLLARSKSA